MRASSALSLAVAAAGSQVAAQVTLTGAPPSTTLTPTPGSPPTEQQANATVVRNNPPGVVYEATFPEEAFFKAAYPEGGNIKGNVVAVAHPDGVGVMLTVKLSNLPKAGGPFTYHLHVAPVPENGNCTATLAHLDPFVRGEDPPCDKENPETCQVGDLSGKYGAISEGTASFEGSYVDLYASTHEGIGAFFGNRSIVIHYANKTRVTCANFVKVADGQGDHGDHDGSACSSATSKPTGGANSTSKPTGTSPTGATGPTEVSVAATTSLRAAGMAGVMAFAAAIMFML